MHSLRGEQGIIEQVVVEKSHNLGKTATAGNTSCHRVTPLEKRFIAAASAESNSTTRRQHAKGCGTRIDSFAQ